MDPCDELETVIQSILAVDYVGFHEILEESPKPLLPLPALPADMGFHGQARTVGGIIGGRSALEAAPHCFHQPLTAAVEQAALTLCQQPPFGQTIVLSGCLQNGQVLGAGNQSFTKLGTELIKPVDQDDELALITQRMLRGEIPDIDSEAIRQILEDSPNPLSPPAGPRSVDSVSSGSSALVSPPFSYHQPLTAAGQAALCREQLHFQTIVLSSGHQNGPAAEESHGLDLGVSRLGSELSSPVQVGEEDDELAIITQRILRGEIPDHSEDIREILEDLPNPLHPPEAAPAETAGSEQSSLALCHTMVLSGDHQSVQAVHRQVQDHGRAIQSLIRPGTREDAPSQGHPEDELALITQRMMKEDMEHIDFDVLREILEESHDPLLLAPRPAAVGPADTHSLQRAALRSFHPSLTAADPEEDPLTLCHETLDSPTVVLSEGHQNGQDHILNGHGRELDSPESTGDPENELELITQRMLRSEILGVESEEIRKILEDSPDPLLSPTETGFSSQPLSVESVSSGCISLGAAFQQPVTAAPAGPTLHGQTIALPGGHQNGQPVTQSQRQFLQNQCPVYTPVGGGAASGITPSFLPNQSQHLVFTPLAASGSDANSFMSLKLPQGVLNMPAVGVVNGEVVYEVPPDVTLSYVHVGTPAQNNGITGKRKRESKDREERPYVKKPPNAFMLFMREHRAKVAAEHSAAANAVLGLMWKSLSKEEQKKYRDEADKERLLHIMRFPEWSCKDNYGKKRRRIRKKPPNITLATLSDPDVTQTVVLETSGSQDFSDYDE